MSSKPEVTGIDKYDGGAWIRCPGCKGVGKIDSEQFAGKVSILCDCGYHETHDLREET